MIAPAVSVVVVSQGRPKSLNLCLLGLGQLFYSNFEVVIVANDASRAGIAQSGYLDRIKVIPFEDANISAARNIGVDHAAGEIIAFIDDDAVPEPTWLDHLIAPFADPRVAASGGFVRGRNGISFQWRGRMIFADGEAADLPIQTNAAQIFPGEKGRAIKTEGTNMAVRRAALQDLGGFDEAFRFYLDETDLNMRIAAAGLHTAIVPLAQVHHGYRASARRTAARTPRDLTDIGRSTAIFARKHRADVLAVEIATQRRERQRLLRFMVAGDLMPKDVRRLSQTLQRGWNNGMSAKFGANRPFLDPPPFRAFRSDFQQASMDVMTGRFWQSKSLMARASASVLGGKRASVFLYSFTSLFHHVRFTKTGVWIQKGGQFGRSDRKMPVFRAFSCLGRTDFERTRLAGIRWSSKENQHQFVNDDQKSN